MHPSLAQVQERIAYQRTALPVMYGDVDFSATPERYTEQVEDSSLPKSLRHLPPPPADMKERVKAYTMLGDITADAYASLMGEYGFKRLVDMLTAACDHGIDAVPDAPKELVALIEEMETRPDWLDMDLVREGARLNRLPMAVTSPWMIRGAFLATFLNKYTALPMAMETRFTSSGVTPISASASITAFSCPKPPSIKTRSGQFVPLPSSRSFRAREKRRRITSRIMP